MFPVFPRYLLPSRCSVSSRSFQNEDPTLSRYALLASRSSAIDWRGTSLARACVCMCDIADPAGGRKFKMIAGYIDSGEAARTLSKNTRQALNPSARIRGVNSFKPKECEDDGTTIAL